MKKFKKFISSAVVFMTLLSLVPPSKCSVQAAEFDAYRKPVLSGPSQTWIYQGETYGMNKTKVFADDQEDGDLTAKIKQTGTVNTLSLIHI